MSLGAVSIALLALSVSEFAKSAPAWTPAGDRLKTRFAGGVIPDQLLPAKRSLRNVSGGRLRVLDLDLFGSGSLGEGGSGFDEAFEPGENQTSRGGSGLGVDPRLATGTHPRLRTRQRTQHSPD